MADRDGGGQTEPGDQPRQATTGGLAAVDSLGIVVPAYRPDVEVLSEYLHALDEALDPAALRVELDVPDEDVLSALADTPATVASAPQRRGKGAAITAGFEALETDILAFADADGSTPVAELRRVLEAVETPAVDLAVGSRRHPDATVATDQSPSRSLMGDGFAWLARRALDVSLYDYQCGAKAVTAEGWQQVREHLTETGFAWDIELVAFADALGLDVREVPITWHDHPGSTVPPVRAATRMAAALARTSYRARRLDPGWLVRRLDAFGTGVTTILGRGPPRRDE